MKIFIVFVLLLLSSIESRRHNDKLYGLDELLGNQRSNKHRPNNIFDNNDDDDDDDDDEYFPLRRPHEKASSYHKKPSIQDEPDEDYQRDGDYENEDATERLLLSTTPASVVTPSKDISFETSSCFHNYDTKHEQLIKVKELKNGAHLIRHETIDKTSLPSNINVHDGCMLACCREKTCDLAMIGEQSTRDGYKCYLFACNGNCALAPHEDYTIMVPKKDAALYNESLVKHIDVNTSTSSNVHIEHKTSIFRETAVVLFLIFGLMCTIILFALLYCYCRQAKKRGRGKDYAVDADYLINGLYL